MRMQHIARTIVVAAMAFGMVAERGGRTARTQEAERPRDRDGRVVQPAGMTSTAATRRYLVRYKEDKREEMKALCESRGFQIVREIPEARILVCEPAWRRAQFTVAAYTASMATIQGAEATEGFDLDYLAHVPRHPATTSPANAEPGGQIASVAPAAPKLPNDEFFRKGFLWGLGRIQAPRAWATQSTSRFIVAVIDTGVDYGHPDLKASIYHIPRADWGVGGELGLRSLTNHKGSADLYDGITMDDNGHGTHVAGTIAATGDDRMGGLGVAWQGQIMPVKAFDQQGNGRLEDVIAGITYATARGARIINMSFSFGPFNQPNQPTFDILRQTIQDRSDNVLFITCAGNADDGLTPNNNDDPDSPVYPASFRGLDNLITVMAVDRRDEVPKYSNFGRTTVDVAAPGGSGGGRYEDILSTDLYTNQSQRDLWYRWRAGTSMATAHVSGMAALIWANRPTLKPKEVKAAILATAQPPIDPQLARKLGRWCASGKVVQLDLTTPVGVAPGPQPANPGPAMPRQNNAEPSGAAPTESTPSPRSSNPLPPPPQREQAPGCGPGDPGNPEATMPGSAEQEAMPPPDRLPPADRPTATRGAASADPGEHSDFTPDPGPLGRTAPMATPPGPATAQTAGVAPASALRPAPPPAQQPAAPGNAAMPDSAERSDLMPDPIQDAAPFRLPPPPETAPPANQQTADVTTAIVQPPRAQRPAMDQQAVTADALTGYPGEHSDLTPDADGTLPSTSITAVPTTTTTTSPTTRTVSVSANGVNVTVTVNVQINGVDVVPGEVDYRYAQPNAFVPAQIASPLMPSYRPSWPPAPNGLVVLVPGYVPPVVVTPGGAWVVDPGRGYPR